jgi:NNP family nitrate/nitrite transporter-like MFS transporter
MSTIDNVSTIATGRSETVNVSFWEAGHLPTLIGSFFYFDTSFMIWVMLGALGNYIAGSFHLAPAQKGLMTAVPLLAGSVLRLVLGPLADSIGGRKTGLIGMGLTIIPLVGGWIWADSIDKIFAVGLLLGVAGASFAVALPMAGRWYPPQHQGLAMGIAGAGNSGTLFATLFAPRLAERFGWHMVFGLALLPLAFAFSLFLAFAKDAPGARRKHSSAEYLSLLKESDTYRFCLFYAITFGGFSGLISFMPIFLHDQYKATAVLAGDLTSICVLAGSLVRPLGGWIADKVGGIRVLLGLYALIACVLFAVAQLPSLTIAMVLLFAVLACMGLGNGAVFQLVPQRFQSKVGVMTGIVGAAGGVGGFLFPVVLGWFKQYFGSFSFGFGIFGALAAVALITLWAARNQWVGLWLGKGGVAR